jgi:hypothetical protein
MAVPSTEFSVGNPKDPTYQIIRAAEDIQINAIPKELSANKRAGISPSNGNRDTYYNTYEYYNPKTEASHEKDNCVNCVITKR